MKAADTNVLVYAVDVLEPGKQAIAEELLLDWSHESDEPVLLWQSNTLLLGVAGKEWDESLVRN